MEALFVVDVTEYQRTMRATMKQWDTVSLTFFDLRAHSASARDLKPCYSIRLFQPHSNVRSIMQCPFSIAGLMLAAQNPDGDFSLAGNLSQLPRFR
jgi:hypothetical protein